MHPRSRWSPRVFVLVAALLVGSTLWTIHITRRPAGKNAHTEQASPTPAPTHTPAPTPTATVITPAIAPSTRVNAQLVYDNAMNRFLLFSGMDYTGASPLADTSLEMEWAGVGHYRAMVIQKG